MSHTENESLIQCRNCEGYYEASLSECPYCGVSTEDNRATAAAAAAPTVADLGGGFGQPGSTISRVATGIAIALLLLSIGTLIYLGGSVFSRLTGTPQKPTTSEAEPAESSTSAAPEASAPVEPEPESGDPKSIALDTNEITLAEGESYTLTTSIQPDSWEGELTWVSDNPEIASVDETGKLTNVNGGTCTVTVSAGETKTTCTVHCAGVTLEEKKAAEEKAKKEKEEAERKKKEEEKKRKEEEKRKAEEEKKRKEEEERKRQEAEAAAAQQSSGGLKLTLNGKSYDGNDFTLVHVGEGYTFEVTGGTGTYSASSSNSGVVSVSGTSVTATGVGVATVTWSDGSKSVTATIRVQQP